MATGMLPILQATLPQLQSKRKRPRASSVTWATYDKLCQIRLFAADDAPSQSGLFPQDLLEAKKPKLIPCSSSVGEFPEASVTKRQKLHEAAVSAMTTQLNWQCPQRFLCDLSWQIGIGNESSEVRAQLHRDGRVLESFYPRFSVIPASSIEPQEAPSESETPPEIPLMTPEEEEGFGSRSHLGAEDCGARSLSASSVAGIPVSGRADPDVAAAAAAAFAVLKAKESGAPIDHDLLIEILSNPILLETLRAANRNSSNQLCMDASTHMLSRQSSGEIANHGLFTPSHSVGMTSSHNMQGRRIPSEVSGKALDSARQVGDLNAGGGLQDKGRPELGSRKPLVSAAKGILGQGAAATVGEACFLPGHDGLRNVFEQGSRAGVIRNNEALRQTTRPLVFHDVKRQPLLWSYHKPNALSLATPMSNPSLGTQDRPGSAPKNKRQCFFFNTTKGCRNGIHCTFLHDPPSLKKPYPDKANPSGGAQELKVAKTETADA